LNKGSVSWTKSQLTSSHSLLRSNSPLGSYSGLHNQMQGRPHSTVRFFLYLSVRTKDRWHPRKDFHWGKYLTSKSSSTMYLASPSQSSRLNCPQKYIWRPRDLAHSVFPYLEGDITTKDRGRPPIYQIILNGRGGEGTPRREGRTPELPSPLGGVGGGHTKEKDTYLLPPCLDSSSLKVLVVQ